MKPDRAIQMDGARLLGGNKGAGGAYEITL